MSEDEVREWSDWLDEAAEEPEWLGSADLAGGPPREVDKRSCCESQLHGGQAEDQPLLGRCQVAPPLLRGHDSN